MITYGIGKNEEEARADLRRKKMDALPVVNCEIPKDLTPEEFDLLIRERAKCVLHDLAELNTLAIHAPAGVTDDYRESVRMSVHDMWASAHPIWQSTYDKVPGQNGTVAGWFLRQLRLGTVKPGGTFRFVPPGEKQENDK